METVLTLKSGFYKLTSMVFREWDKDTVYVYTRHDAQPWRHNREFFISKTDLKEFCKQIETMIKDKDNE